MWVFVDCNATFALLWEWVLTTSVQGINKFYSTLVSSNSALIRLIMHAQTHKLKVNRASRNILSCEIHYHFRSEEVYAPETGRRKSSIASRKYLAHSCTTLLTTSKDKFSKAKQTGMLMQSEKGCDLQKIFQNVRRAERQKEGAGKGEKPKSTLKQRLYSFSGPKVLK